MKTVTAIYVRQSAERADSVSLETQEALCRTEISAETAVRVYADRGCSGKNTDRPALQQLLRDIESGEIAAVLVYKLDRISRNLADFTQLLRTFERCGVQFSSHTERFETQTPMGQAMQSLLMVFAQLERETICGRVRDAAFARAKIGFDTGGVAPIGYRKVPTLLMNRRTQMLAPDENAAQIADGFRAYLSADGSLSMLAQMWNSACLRTNRGGLWTSAAVGRVLRNPVYARADGDVYAYLASMGAELCVPAEFSENHGVYLYTDRRKNHAKLTDLHGVYAIAAPHEGIVSADIWIACQEKLTNQRGKRKMGKTRRSPYLGMLFCGNCGSAVTAVRGRSAEYLVCGGKKRGKCEGIGETWRLEVLSVLLEDAFARRLRELSVCSGENPTSEQFAVRQSLDAAKLRKIQLERSLLELTDAEIKPIAAAIAALDTRCAELEEKLHRKPATIQEFSEFTSLSFAEQKQVAMQTALCVVLRGDTATVYFR